jgi:enediyne biosynthesis protein E5
MALSFLYKSPANPRKRLLMGLINSSALATLLTVLGHTLLGFEQSLSQLATAIVTGYACAIGFESLDAWAQKRSPRYLGEGVAGFLLFMISNHMTSITLSFLVYPGDLHGVMAFTVACAIASKYLFRVRVDGKLKHFLNPSNTGIIAAICFFPFVNTIPYAFTEKLSSQYDWMVPAIILLLGIRLNTLFTKRLYLIASWVLAFAVQGALRSFYVGTPLSAELFVLTGPAFVLFTFYMITDPMTSPERKSSQIVFGVSLAAVYSALMAVHVANQIFLTVLIVTGARGILMWYSERRKLAATTYPLQRETLVAQPKWAGATAKI